MADRYQIITGKAPDPPPSPPKKKSELDFLIESHDKLAQRMGGEKEFRERVNHLYLEGQISHKSYQIISKKYKWALLTRWFARTPGRQGSSVGGSCGATMDNGRC